MGSWHETCAISNMAIMPGDRVKVLILQENVTHDRGQSGCYSTDFWAPASIPFSAVYDDYGRVTDFDENGIHANIILDALRAHHQPIPQGENSCHDIAVPHVDNWPTMWEGLAQGRLALKHAYGRSNREDPIKQRPDFSVCAKIYIREDVWDAICAGEIESWRNTVTVKSLFDDGLKYFKEKIQALHQMEIENATGEDSAEAQLRRDLRAFRFLNSDNEWRRQFSNFQGGSAALNSCLEALTSQFSAGTLTLDHPEFLRLLKNLAELAFMANYFNHTRRTWHPTVGSGSQEDDHMTRVDFFIKMAAVALTAYSKSNSEIDHEYSAEDRKKLRNLRAQIAKLEKTVPTGKNK